MKHLNQNCGSSCGPTSLRMIMDVMGYRKDLGIQDIFSMAPTKIGGTPWPRMVEIIKSLGIKHRVLVDVNLRSLLHEKESKVWMLAVYYGKTKHWVVLKPKDGKFIVYDPADRIKEYTHTELNNIFASRNSLAIEFDLDDFLGESPEYNVRDDDGDYVMDHVNENQMVLLEDSNHLFGLKGKRTLKIEDIYNPAWSGNDYVYGLFDRSEVFFEKYVFALSKEKAILLRFKS